MIVAILVLFAFVIAVVVHLREPRDIPQTVRLPDGSELSLISASYGTNHVAPESVVGRMINKLPAWLFPKSKVSVNTVVPHHEPALGVWLELRPGNLEAESTNPSKDIPFFYTLVDDSGVESACMIGLWGRFGSSQNLRGPTFGAFPRRSPFIRLRVYENRDSDTNTPLVATFQFANPEFRHYPTWKPGPATARNLAGDLEVTVRKLTVCPGNGVYAANYPRCTFESGRLSAEATFEIKYQGRTATNWSVDLVNLTDAMGNQSIPYMERSRTKDGEVSVRFGPALWPDGSAWKMKVWVAPKEPHIQQTLEFMVMPDLISTNRTNVKE